MGNKWFKEAYHRNVIDMHISDVDDSFLSQIDVKSYVEMLRKSKAESAVVYAHSHAGLCYYPTQVGRMHPLLQGRDLLKEIIEECHHAGIHVVVYLSLIFDNWASHQNPDWRVINAKGEEQSKNSRTKVLCPNSPGYRDYVQAITSELCKNYEFEGIRFDMTFWPGVCYCKYCSLSFLEEANALPPKIINWNDPTWVQFQQHRERKLIEFAQMATDTVRQIQPDVTVEHQASTFIHPWTFGVTSNFRKAHDFMQGDFYGGYVQGTFACKLYYNLSPQLPFGFETCSNENLHDHTTMKHPQLLEAKACMALANGGAFIFIDGIDPVGTLNSRLYETMGSIFERTRAFEPYLGGQLVQDVAIYLSTESKFDPADNGKFVMDSSLKTPHVDAALQAGKALIRAHVPFGVITKENIASLHKHKVVILPNVLVMSEEEVHAFKSYVADGGKIYASKYTSLTDQNGNKQSDFLLSDVFGVRYESETIENFSYMAPTIEGAPLFNPYSEKYPLSIKGTQLRVIAHEGATILGHLVLPYTDPNDSTKFASIHSNPPGPLTHYASTVHNRYGKGEAVYCAGDLENNEYHLNTFVNIIQHLCPEGFTFESDTHPGIEFTAFHQPENQRYIVNLLNFQELLPNIPIRDVNISIRSSYKVNEVLLLPSKETLPFIEQDGKYSVCLSEVAIFSMLSFHYSI